MIILHNACVKWQVRGKHCQYQLLVSVRGRLRDTRARVSLPCPDNNITACQVCPVMFPSPVLTRHHFCNIALASDVREAVFLTLHSMNEKNWQI